MRLISLVLIVGALMLLGADAVTSLERGGEVTVRSVAQIWALFSKASMDGFKAWTQHNLPSSWRRAFFPSWRCRAGASPGGRRDSGLRLW